MSRPCICFVVPFSLWLSAKRDPLGYLLLKRDLQSSMDVYVLGANFPTKFASLLHRTTYFTNIMIASSTSASNMSMISVKKTTFSATVDQKLPTAFSPLWFEGTQ